MKRLLLVFASVFVAIACFGQDNIIYKEVPAGFDIRDCIIVENDSPYYIQQIAIAVPVDNGFRPIGVLNDLDPDDDDDIDVDDSKLMYSLIGNTIAIKVKGIRFLVPGVDDIDDAKPDEIEAIYGFDVKLFAKKHDLIIRVNYVGEPDGLSVMDF